MDRPEKNQLEAPCKMMIIKDTMHLFMQRASIDRPVFFGLLTRVFNLITGPITGILMISVFTAKLQGYYYTFQSLVALQTFAELGLSIVILQFAAHEWSSLSLDNDGNIIGDNVALSRLASLTRFVLKWYGIAAIFVLIGLGVGGYLFFSRSPDPSIDWEMPWFSLCFITSIAVLLLPITSILEGCNQVSNLYTYSFYQALFVKITLWLTILLHTNLWVLTFSNIASIICIITLILRKYKVFSKTLIFSFKVKEKLHWSNDIWPMQWKIGLSCLCGYFVHYFFIPILFKYHGAVVAGQMGMTWSVVGLIPSIPTAWIAPKIPQFGMLIARREYEELDRLFWRLMKITIVVSGFISFSGWLIVYILNVLQHPFAARLLPPLPMGIFAFAQIFQAISVPMAGYLRAHKQEPLLLISVLAAILITCSNVFLGRYFSAMGMAVGYMISLLIVIPLVAWQWYRLKGIWHGDGKTIVGLDGKVSRYY